MPEGPAGFPWLRARPLVPEGRGETRKKVRGKRREGTRSDSQLPGPRGNTFLGVFTCLVDQLLHGLSVLIVPTYAGGGARSAGPASV